MEDLSIDLEELEGQVELQELLLSSRTTPAGQAAVPPPTSSAATPAAKPTSTVAIADQVDFKKFLTKEEEKVLRDISVAMQNIGVELTLGNGLIVDYISISNLKDTYQTMIQNVLGKHNDLIYVQDLQGYFKPTGRPSSMKRKHETVQEKLPRLDHLK